MAIPLQDTLDNLRWGKALDLGLFISDYEDEIYACWFRPRILSWDSELSSARGFLSYDSTSSAYIVSPAGEGSVSPNSRRLDTRKCIVETDGTAGLGLNLNYVDLANFGEVKYLTVPDSATLNLSMAFDFLFYDPALNMIADSLVKANLIGVDITSAKYMNYMNFAMGKTKADEMQNDIGLYGNMRRMPEELVHTIVLTDVNLFWNSETNSYISRGPIGVMSVGRNVSIAM